ncbi:MAG: hypothetical protein GX066_05295 [Clostridiaceae bacterium]|nr:hypothetical protein [Clostridiaceae bacterium]
MRFIIILSVEIVGVSLLVLSSIYVTFSINKNKKISNNNMQSVGQSYVVKKRSSNRRLVKLERRNLNWSDEDIQRKHQDFLPLGSTDETGKKEFSYRSPFEPINPPAIAYEEKEYEEDIDDEKDSIDEKDNTKDDMDDENKIIDVSEEQKTQNPPKYKVKVVRKKKKKMGSAHIKKRIQNKDLLNP